MMKIMVVGHTYVAAMNKLKWITFAQRYPHVQIAIVSPSIWKDSLGELINEMPEEVVVPANSKFFALNASYVGNEVLYTYSWTELCSLLAEFHPDMVLVEEGESALSVLQTYLCSLWYAPNARRAFFTWVNWEHPLSFFQKLWWGAVRFLNRIFSHGAIVGNSDAGKILEMHGFEGAIKVCPQLGVELHEKVEIITKPEYKIGFIGRLVPEKGISDLLEAFCFLAPAFPEWKLVFLGAGPLEQMILDHSLHNDCLGRIELTGVVTHSEVLSLLPQYDIVVLPSHDTPVWREQFGHVIIEAMSFGIPVIGTDAGEIPIVVDTAGLVAKQQDVRSLTQKLKKFMASVTLRKHYGTRGYNRVKVSYTHEAIAEQTYDFFEKLCARSNQQEK